MSKPAGDEPEDPRLEMQRQAQEFARQLMQTSALPGKLGWEDFDFDVDPFDPLLDDLESLAASGERNEEALTSILNFGIGRHVVTGVRHRLLQAVERQLEGEVRLDVRQEGQLVLQALQQLSIPPASIGLVWGLYPRHVMMRLRKRHEMVQHETHGMTGEEHALVDALSTGKREIGSIQRLGPGALPIVDRVLHAWIEKPPAAGDVVQEVCRLAGQWPGPRMARVLSMLLWHVRDATVCHVVREALKKMPEVAVAILELDLAVHDPGPEARRALYSALIDLGSTAAIPRMVEDCVGAGGWSTPGKGLEHTRAILADLMRSGDRRVVPMMLLVFSVRPPANDIRAEVKRAFSASSFRDAFERGLKALEAGRPVVVPHGMDQNEFFARYGTFSDQMRQEKFQVELQRVLALWQSCYHEELGWKSPLEMAGEMGPRERELRQALEQDVRQKLGRLVGKAPVAALESEYRTKWLVTSHNDVSGRVPLAIILDEHEARGVPSRELRGEREQHVVELYGLALQAVEGNLKEDAERFLRAILQILPGHEFAVDALKRLAAGDSLPGVGTAGSGSPAAVAETPRIIIP